MTLIWYIFTFYMNMLFLPKLAMYVKNMNILLILVIPLKYLFYFNPISMIFIKMTKNSITLKFFHIFNTTIKSRFHFTCNPYNFFIFRKSIDFRYKITYFFLRMTLVLGIKYAYSAFSYFYH